MSSPTKHTVDIFDVEIDLNSDMAPSPSDKRNRIASTVEVIIHEHRRGNIASWDGRFVTSPTFAGQMGSFLILVKGNGSEAVVKVTGINHDSSGKYSLAFTGSGLPLK